MPLRPLVLALSLALLPALPATLRAPVVVVLHLPKERPSLLSDIFRQRCALQVCEAGDKELARAGVIYFAPPDYHLLLDEGSRLTLSVDEPVNYSRPSIDVLFESAADVYRQNLIGILLSGANDDGARGLAAIHDAGGMAIVQQPESAKMQTMPLAAFKRIPSACVLSPHGMISLLMDLHRGRTL